MWLANAAATAAVAGTQAFKRSFRKVVDFQMFTKCETQSIATMNYPKNSCDECIACDVAE